MKSPKISLILPCYNSVQYIEETFRSIILQDYSELELIVVDAGSNDGTLDIINNYSNICSKIISEPDNGQSDAINKGIQYCTGDIFYWINADDYLEPNVLQLVADEYIKSNFDVLCVNNRAFDDATGNTTEVFSARFYNSIEQTIVEGGMSITLFYKLEKVKSLFPISENLHYAMDFELYYRFAFKFGVVGYKYSEVPVVTHFRMHLNSKTFTQQNTSYTDLNAIHYSILKQIEAPEFLLEYYSLLDRNKNYQGIWNLENVNKNDIFGFYARKVALKAYSDRNYEIARKAIMYAFKSPVKFGKFDWYRLFILLFRR